jgi:dephospho-CoA kinase
LYVVGLTGGIGSGKSTLAALLVERGAQVIDADELGRDALRPGEPAWHSTVDTFGREILSAGSMTIDRARLADIVFADTKKLAALNAIIHPIIFSGIADELDRLRPTDAIVILDAALLLETGLDAGMDCIVAVTTHRDLRSDRLRRDRGMTVSDIQARMGAQKPPEELEARADIVVTNDGDIEALAREADRVWAELERRSEAAG